MKKSIVKEVAIVLVAGALAVGLGSGLYIAKNNRTSKSDKAAKTENIKHSDKDWGNVDSSLYPLDCMASSEVNMWEKPTTESNPIYIFQEGEMITITGEEKDVYDAEQAWYKAENINGDAGYIQAEYFADLRQEAEEFEEQNK